MSSGNKIRRPKSHKTVEIAIQTDQTDVQYLVIEFKIETKFFLLITHHASQQRKKPMKHDCYFTISFAISEQSSYDCEWKRSNGKQSTE